MAAKCRGLRRHKLHILSHAASAMAQSFRCASSPQKVHGLFGAYIEFYAWSLRTYVHSESPINSYMHVTTVTAVTAKLKVQNIVTAVTAVA